VLAEHLPQRCVDQMGGRVVGARRRAARVINRQRHASANVEAASFDNAHMHEYVAELLLRVGDAKHGTLSALDNASVAMLAAALAIKGCLIDDDGALVAFGKRRHGLAAFDKCAHFARCHGRGIRSRRLCP
jgi:hypothetical protein